MIQGIVTRLRKYDNVIFALFTVFITVLHVTDFVYFSLPLYS